jgi:hypothetical protein
MDVDDEFFRDPTAYRRMGCSCASEPGAPATAHGCVCTGCGARCLECPGFGYAQAPEKRFHQILSRARSIIRRKVRTRGRPPGYLRLTVDEIRVLVRKRRAEDPQHWINEYVDLGPPVRLFDVIVVIDRRKR